MNIKSFFPLTENQIYLNTAASGLLPKPVYEFKLKDKERFFENGSGYLKKEDEIIEVTKAKISKIFNVKKDRVGLTPNFSLAYNAVLDSMPRSLKFLCLDEDYLSVTMPIKLKGFTYNSIPISADLEDQIYKHILKYDIDVLALSIVQYLNGIKLNLEFFKQLKSDFPNLKIMVDATQYLGVESFSFDTSGIDFLASSCYKWLSAGFGNAISMFSESFFQDLSFKQAGSNSFADKAKLEMKPMGFLEPGHYDLNTVGALCEALDFHYNTIGIKYIQQQIKSISENAFSHLASMGLIEQNVVERNAHSNIFMLKIKQEKFTEFEKAKIILSKRGDGLRISFNYFNTFDDLEHLIAFLKA